MATNQGLYDQIDAMEQELRAAVAKNAAYKDYQGIYFNYMNLYKNEYPKAEKYIRDAYYYFSELQADKYRRCPRKFFNAA